MRLRSTSDPGVGLGRDTLPNLKARKPIAKGEAGRGKGKGVKVVVKRMVMGKRKARAAPGSAQAALSGPAPQARRKSSAAGSATLQADTLNEIFARVESQTVCRWVLPALGRTSPSTHSRTDPCEPALVLSCREVLPLVCKRFRDALAEPSAVWEVGPWCSLNEEGCTAPWWQACRWQACAPPCASPGPTAFHVVLTFLINCGAIPLCIASRPSL